MSSSLLHILEAILYVFCWPAFIWFLFKYGHRINDQSKWLKEIAGQFLSDVQVISPYVVEGFLGQDKIRIKYLPKTSGRFVILKNSRCDQVFKSNGRHVFSFLFGPLVFFGGVAKVDIFPGLVLFAEASVPLKLSNEQIGALKRLRDLNGLDRLFNDPTGLGDARYAGFKIYLKRKFLGKTALCPAEIGAIKAVLAVF